MTTSRSRYGSSGFKSGVKAKSRPVVAGVHCSMIAPFGTYTKPRRRCGLAALFAMAVSAGTIASRNGSATVAPTPRRNVRRGNDSFEMNMFSPSARTD